MDHSVRSPAPAAANGQGFEPRDADVRGIVIFGVCLVVTVVVVLVLIYAVQQAITGPRRPEPMPPPPAVLPEQVREMRASAEKTLGEYGWVDRKAGRVRIPIDRAIDLAARRGVPHGKGPKTEVEINSHHGKQP